LEECSKGDDYLEQDKTTVKLEATVSRRKRINRIKIIIIVLIIACLILPTIISIVLFIKVNSLQDQIDVLMIEKYGVTYNELRNKNHEEVAHAAVVAEDLSVEQSSDTDELESETSSDKQQISENNSLQTNNKNKTANEISDFTNVLDFKLDKENMKSKKVYLSFDDGPSQYTGDILDILAKYNEKATFFVIGKTDEYSKSMYQRIVNEGHTLGIHSYSHVYQTIYKSLEDFDKDFTKLSDLLYDTTGYLPHIYRFPGGSGNDVSKIKTSKIIEYLNKKNIIYFDWNVVNGDATGNLLTPEELYYNVIKGININNTSIVLMHDTDTKENTVKSLEPILKTLTEFQTEILPLDKDVTPIQQVTAE
jgi:peptidoglycan/xylan/chitin deacetylase (PgdA/CDA1 family)